MENISCNYYASWEEGDHFSGNHGQDRHGVGQVCEFQVENNQATQWQLTESFECGNSGTRVIMCEKAFEFFKWAGERYGFESAHTSHMNPNVWAAILALAIISILLNIFLIIFIYRLKKTCQIAAEQSKRPVYQSALSYEENIIRGNLLRDLSIDPEVSKEEIK